MKLTEEKSHLKLGIIIGVMLLVGIATKVLFRIWLRDLPGRNHPRPAAVVNSRELNFDANSRR